MSLSIRDQEILWHPYSSAFGSPAPIPITRAKGTLLYDEKDCSYIDAISSWWVNLHGHAHPHIASRIADQALKLEHTIFAGFTHAPAIELAERILKHLPTNQAKVFYSDNGSTAVEVALKMALQYWWNQGIKKDRILALKNSYHGDTFGAMSVSGRGAFTNPYGSLLFDVIHIPAPTNNSLELSLSLIEAAACNGNIAAIIYEPLLQGAGGMQLYPASNLEQILALCKKHKIITIADEVLTGFGRTGKFIASDYISEKPDIICLAKGLSGGFMPLALTTCSQEIFEPFRSSDRNKMFFHGHSYTANPLACAAGLASLDLLERKECWERISRIEQQHSHFADSLSAYDIAKSVRRIGTMVAFEVVTEEQSGYFNQVRDQLYTYFIEKGVLLRPLGNTVYILPPYCITDSELIKTYTVIKEALSSLSLSGKNLTKQLL